MRIGCWKRKAAIEIQMQSSTREMRIQWIRYRNPTTLNQYRHSSNDSTDQKLLILFIPQNDKIDDYKCERKAEKNNINELVFYGDSFKRNSLYLCHASQRLHFKHSETKNGIIHFWCVFLSLMIVYLGHCIILFHNDRSFEKKRRRKPFLSRFIQRFALFSAHSDF